MPNISWKRSERGGWFCIDEQENYWYMFANKEFVTVDTPDGRNGSGWTPEIAWRSLSGDCT